MAQSRSTKRSTSETISVGERSIHLDDSVAIRSRRASREVANTWSSKSRRYSVRMPIQITPLSSMTMPSAPSTAQCLSRRRSNAPVIAIAAIIIGSRNPAKYPVNPSTTSPASSDGDPAHPHARLAQAAEHQEEQGEPRIGQGQDALGQRRDFPRELLDGSGDGDRPEVDRDQRPPPEGRLGRRARRGRRRE